MWALWVVLEKLKSKLRGHFRLYSRNLSQQCVGNFCDIQKLDLKQWTQFRWYSKNLIQKCVGSFESIQKNSEQHVYAF